jgi:hypothetical protein
VKEYGKGEGGYKTNSDKKIKPRNNFTDILYRIIEFLRTDILHILPRLNNGVNFKIQE